MFSLKVFTLLACALSAIASPVPEVKSIRLPLSVRDSSSNSDYFDVFSDPHYEVHLGLGTNKVQQVATIDTGSYALFVKNYDYNASTTSHYLNEPFESWIGGNSVRRGQLINDTVSIGNAPSVPVSVAVQDEEYSLGSLIGLHFIIDDFYGPNWVIQLKEAGYVDTASFSIWYDKDVDHGEITFGAYDKAKISGDLSKLTLTHPDEGSWNYPTNGITTPDGKVHFAGEGVTFDSGNNNIVLPEDVLQEIQKSLPGSTWEENYISYPNCSFTPDQKIVIGFGTSNIEIPLHRMSYVYANKCALLFQIGSPTFGLPVLNNALTIFNIDDRSVSIANRNYTSASEVVPVV